MERDEKSFYTYFKEYNSNLIDCVYNAATSKQARAIFLKKWGSNLRGVLISNMTDEDNDLFKKHISIFEKYLAYASKLQKRGYSLSQIKKILMEKSAIQNVSSKRTKSVIIYDNVNSILRKYNITKQEMMQVLDTLINEKRRCFIYLYGIDRQKMNLEKVEEVLHISHMLALGYLQAVYDALEKYQMNRDFQNDVLPPINEKQPRKASIYLYFEPSEVEYVTKSIKWYSDHHLKYYNVILKCYGKHYDRWNSNVKLTKEEENILDYIIGSDLPSLVNQMKHNRLKRGAGARKKQSIYDYFKEEEKAYVTERIELWSTENETYYNLIVKLYGKEYDCLDTTMQLTKEEIALWNRILAILQQYVSKRKNGSVVHAKLKRKQSIYDYFTEEEKAYVTERIEWWKTNNPVNYDFIVKLYGLTYDCLNNGVELTRKEQKSWSNILTNLKQYVSKRKNGPVDHTKRKQSIYDYFTEEEKAYVTERIEWWKTNNPVNYDFIVKLYGLTYDCLNNGVELTRKEQKSWSNILTNLKQYVSKRKNGPVDHTKRKRQQSIYDYFTEEEKAYVMERIEWWKTNNPARYDFIVKLYGITYDCLNKDVELTREEQKFWSNILNNLKEYVSKRKNGSVGHTKLTRQQSIYDYFTEEEKAYVMEKIEWWKTNNPANYDFIVKLYGITYDCLDMTIKLTKDEQEIWNGLLANLKQYVSKRKNGSVVHAKSKRQQSIYDYFTEEEKTYVMERIEWWKTKNPARYDFIVKLYGITYDCLNKDVELTKDEQEIWNGLLANLKQYVSKRKNGSVVHAKSKRQQSIYDYFTEEEKTYVMERIEWWKTNNPVRYDFIVKLYGITYDCLDMTIKLTKDEQEIWNGLLANLKQYVSKRKNGSVVHAKSKRQQSIYDYFTEEEKTYVMERIEWWKTNNPVRYGFIVKLYGMTYDCLNKDVELTREEQKSWSNILINLKQYVSKRTNGSVVHSKLKRKQSIYDYFTEEEKAYVMEKIEWWKTKNPARYDFIVKLYGITYDCLDMTIKLTKDEQEIWNSLLANLKQYVSKRTNGSVVHAKSKRKQSIYDYFKEEDKAYVTERIEWWKINNLANYDLIVKRYGLTYDCLNKNVKLTEEEQKLWHSLLTNLKQYVSKKNNDPVHLISVKKDSEITSSSPIDYSIPNNIDFDYLIKINNLNIQDVSPQELILLAYYEQHQEIKEQELCNTLGISIETLDCFYIKYLHKFKENTPQIIKRMITRNPNNVNRILTESYLKEFMTNLTAKEKIYLQLKLQSYFDPKLTDDVIAKIIGVTLKDLESYEIMTPYEELNQLNQLIKKLKK